ncbi:MAG TPA: porin [bacterium]
MKTNTTVRLSAHLFSLALFMAVTEAVAQEEQQPIKIFGYFQNSFQEWTAFEDQPKFNSFSLQQLNLFFQKDFGPSWTAFVNFEFVNNFSSSRQWGSANLEEAWLKYQADMRFNLKLGLLLPIFNNLNEIKNRTPLLPYVIRPLAYETSFSEIIPIEVLTPVRAFVQAYGFFPSGEVKIDYAAYVGNSPNINDNSLEGQTGVDTTATFLVGGRLGVRYRELKLGLSATYDKDNIFESRAADFDIPRPEWNEIPKTRLGGDLSYEYANFSFESEFIKVDMEKDTPGLSANLDFYYATLGYRVTEKLFLYSSYWVMDSRLVVLTPGLEVSEGGDIRVYTLGGWHRLTDRISLKAQFSRVISKEENHLITEDETTTVRDNFSVFGLAVSVFF